MPERVAVVPVSTRTKGGAGRRSPRQLWRLELLGTLSRRRALAIKMGFPLLLVIPLAATHAPQFFAGMLLTVLMAMVGTVGTGVSVTRSRGAGWLDRLAALWLRFTPAPGPRPVAQHPADEGERRRQITPTGRWTLQGAPPPMTWSGGGVPLPPSAPAGQVEEEVGVSRPAVPATWKRPER